MADIDSAGAEPGPLNRRTVVQGIAWTAPVVLALGATPAFAATVRGALTVTGPTYIYAGTFVNGSTSPQPGTGNYTAVPFSGTTPAINAPQTVTVTIGTASASVFVPANQTTWGPVNVDASGIADGLNLTVTATSSSASVTPGTTSITKDTVPPALTLTTIATDPNKKFGSLSGGKGTAVAVTADVAALTHSSTSTGISFGTFTYPTAATWSLTWTWTPAGNALGQVITIGQADVAGNISLRTYTVV